MELVGYLSQRSSLFRVDPIDGSLCPLPSAVCAEFVDRHSEQTDPQGNLRLVLLTRPGKSIRKYGDRGYWYSLLDAGHVLSNLVHLSGYSGLDVAVSLPQTGHPGSRELGDWLEHVATIDVAVEPKDASDLAQYVQSRPAREWPVDASERQAWIDTRRRLYPGFDAPAIEQTPGLELRLRPENVCRGGPAADIDGLVSLLTHRVSSKSFDRAPDAMEAIETVARLVAQSALAAATLAIAPGLQIDIVYSSAVTPRHDLSATPEDLRACCMGQDIGLAASALVIFHHASPPSGSSLRHLTALSAALAQQYYLAAAATGTGITCIGAFDDARIKNVARLGDAQEVINLLLLGPRTTTAAEKLDRDTVAYSHGHIWK